MTDAATLTAPAPPGPAAPGGPGGWLRRNRAVLVVTAALVAAVLFAVLGRSDDGYTGAGDPQNSGKDGARALAGVLEDQGVDVTVVRNAEALDDARIDAATTVVVTGPENLGPSTAERFREDVAGAAVVLVEPRYGTTDLLGLDESTPLLDGARAQGDCADPRFDDLRISVRSATAYPEGRGGCFGVPGGALLTFPEPGWTLLGSTDLITNDRILRADNAAVALRLLGGKRSVVWYVPDPADVTAGDGTTVSALLPRWLRPVLLLGALALLSVLWWRGRRLGRLAVEPLPVAVTAIETTRSRGRLYRKAGDRPHAAGALRRAARRRLADSLGLPRAAADDVPVLVRDVAPFTVLTLDRLTALLDGNAPAPATDHDLIRLANDLADLMREVRRS